MVFWRKAGMFFFAATAVFATAAISANRVSAQMLTGPAESTESTAKSGVISPAAYGAEAPVDMTADNLENDEQNQVITASGNVELEQSGRILRADMVSYDMKADKITARGNVVLTEPNGDVHFADQVELSNKMRDGFVSSLQTFLAGGGNFTAKQGERTDGSVVTMRDASYTPCDCEEDKNGTPAWQIKADEVRYNEAENRVSYKNAQFEMFGVPVAYTPYLSHPDGKIKRKSGLLTPELGYDSELGFMAAEKYYWAIAPNRDATFGTLLTSKEIPVGLFEYRHRFANAELMMDASATYSERIDSVAGREVQTDNEFRGHLFAEGLWDINDNWRAGLDVEVTGDDQYLRQYDFSSKDVLENEVYLERFSGRDYAVGRMLAFQDVRVLEEQTDQPNILPEVIASFKGDPGGFLGGRWEAEASALGLQRNDGQDMTRLTGKAAWQRRFVADAGVVTTVDASVRADAYAVNDRNIATPASGRSGDGQATRLFPQAHIMTSYPLTKNMKKMQAVIEPMLALTAAPNIDTTDGDIPNEDSQDVQIDASNLFEPSRFPGSDRLEDRTRVTYGVRTGLHGHEGSFGDVFIGQSYNLTEDDNPFPVGSGLTRQESDYVGQISGAIDGTYGLNYRFQLSGEDMSSTRHELDGYADWNRLQLDTRYLYAKALGGTDIEESREQLEVGAAFGLTKSWRVRGAALQDLGEDPGLRKATFGFDYAGCCLSFSATARRNLTSDVSGDSGTDVTFRVGLKGLGDFASPGPGGFTGNQQRRR